jgi:hypothetical protein
MQVLNNQPLPHRWSFWQGLDPDPDKGSVLSPRRRLTSSALDDKVGPSPLRSRKEEPPVSVTRPRPIFAIAILVAAFLAFLAIAAAPSPAPLPFSVSVASAADRDCSDFKNQRRAQRFFKRHHPRRDPHRLDRDNDGIACERLFCPCNEKPAFRTSAPGSIARP